MKCALHVHTNLSDGCMELEEAVRIYADLGFGCVAITDHEFLLRKNYTSMVERTKKYGMVVLAGMEIDYVPWHYQHLLRVDGDKETLNIMCHPSAYYLEIDEVIKRLDSEPFPIDAVEISYRGFYTPKYDTDSIEVPKIASDDSHEPRDCGRAWIEMDEVRDPDEIIRRVRAGDFKARFYRSSPG